MRDCGTLPPDTNQTPQPTDHLTTTPILRHCVSSTKTWSPTRITAPAPRRLLRGRHFHHTVPQCEISGLARTGYACPHRPSRRSHSRRAVATLYNEQTLISGAVQYIGTQNPRPRLTEREFLRDVWCQLRARFNRAGWIRRNRITLRCLLPHHIGWHFAQLHIDWFPALYGSERILGGAIGVLHRAAYALDQRLPLHLVGHAQHAG